MIRTIIYIMAAIFAAASFQNCAKPLSTNGEGPSVGGTSFSVKFYAVSAAGELNLEFTEGTLISLVASHEEIPGESMYTYSVNRNGLSEELSTSPESSYEYGAVGLDDNGATFSVKVVTSDGVSYVQKFDLVVHPAPALELDFYLANAIGERVTSIQAGTIISLHADHADDGQVFDYNWYKDDVLIANTQVNSFDYGVAQLDDNGAVLKVVVSVDLVAEYSKQLTLSVTQTPLNFTWHFGSSCPSGTFNMVLQDDSDNFQSLSEATSSGLLKTLCATGITGVRWEAECSAGFVDTLLRDDLDARHNLNENGGNCAASTRKWCLQGIVESLWALKGQCPAGWASVPIYDDTDNSHCLGEASGTDRIQLCVR